MSRTRRVWIIIEIAVISSLACLMIVAKLVPDISQGRRTTEQYHPTAGEYYIPPPPTTLTPTSKPLEYDATWEGKIVALTLVTPTVNISAFPDATLVGVASHFETTMQTYSCLAGLSLQVYTAPRDYPGVYLAIGSCPPPSIISGSWTFPRV